MESLGNSDSFSFVHLIIYVSAYLGDRYNFLAKSVGISSLFEITDDSLVDDVSQTVQTHFPLHVPGVESLQIPSETRGHILRVVEGNFAIVRWEVIVSLWGSPFLYMFQTRNKTLLSVVLFEV